MNELSQNRRILLVDDNPAVHDLERILLEQLEDRVRESGPVRQFSGSDSARPPRVKFEIDTALQGQQALEMVDSAAAAGRPYAMAFIDVRMPPGWDGVETTARIWERHPHLQIVLCTAYCDYSWDDMRKRLGQSENLLILKKPFDNMEVLQLAYALTSKWNLTRMANLQIEQLDRLVTERSQQLQQSEQRFAKAFHNNPLAMFIHSLHGERILDANPAFLRLVDRQVDQVLGRTTTEVQVWPAEAATADVLARTRETKDRLVSVRTSSGEERMAYLFTQHFDVGVEPCRLVLLEDVTERLKLEADLRQAHKMEAVGQLAAGVAHDFNNILTIVQGHISLVLSRNHLEEKTHHALAQALSASERAGALTRQLLAFSRKQVIERQPLKLNTLFEQVEAMLARLIGEHIQVEFQCPNELPRIFADRCNIEQVLINLAVNARDAMPQGGKLTIAASEFVTYASHDRHAETPSGRFVCIRVTDTGIGMDEATKRRIFEPFFTTKEPGKGTGMGLATVYGIVKQHQGWVEVESTVGKGTTFTAYLPASVELEETTVFEKSSGSTSKINGHETLLVVEDEDLLVEFVQDVLTSHGYQVLAARNASEAMQIWDREHERVALLLTDMVMPGGVTGKQLAEKLRRSKPDLRVIYSSGYSLDLVGSNASELGVLLLQKPYHASLLVKTVRECLDGSGPRCIRVKPTSSMKAA